jgi:hypothetical protein
MNLEEMRDAQEREAAEQRGAIKRWLTIAEIAVKAVIDSAAHGNVRCREALLELLPLLPGNFVRSAAAEKSAGNIGAGDPKRGGAALDRTGAAACADGPAGGSFSEGGK